VAPFSGGGTDPALLHVTISAGWRSLAPTSAMAGVATRVRVEGAGFEASWEHVLHLIGVTLHGVVSPEGEAPGAALVAACEVLGEQALECAVPPWPHPAQTVEAHLTVDPKP